MPCRACGLRPALQITWQDGFNQVAPFDLLEGLPRKELEPGQVLVPAADELSDLASQILRDAKRAA